MKAMKSAARLFYVFAVLFGTATVATPSLAARASAIPQFQGAWLEQSMTCDQVYTKGNKSPSFKSPRNIFAPAFIISGSRILTPGASCSIQSVREANGRKIMNLSCATSITHSPITVFLAPSQDGGLIRYNDATEKVGSRYERCTP
jgi:hypothetical protein